MPLMQHFHISAAAFTKQRNEALLNQRRRSAKPDRPRGKKNSNRHPTAGTLRYREIKTLPLPSSEEKEGGRRTATNLGEKKVTFATAGGKGDLKISGYKNSSATLK